MLKGITPVVAIILLLMITISIVAGAMIFFGQITEMMEAGAERKIETATRALITDFRIDNVYGNRVSIRNTGAEPLPTDQLGVYIDNVPVEFTPIDAVIQPQSVGTIELTETVIGDVLKITGGLTSSSFKISRTTVYKSENENEYFSNGWRCSKDLYVLENKKIKFFSAAARTYTPNTKYDCNSGISSYDDRFGALPMRLWAKNTDASTYRKNTVIIDDTTVYAAGIATFNFPVSPSISSEKNIITYNGDTTSDLEPTLTYTIFPDSNYIEVRLTVKNVGTSNKDIRLGWGGDQDGAENFTFDDGYEWWCGKDCTCGHSCPHTSYKWVAQWREDKNDIMGYLVEPGSKITINYWQGVWVEHESAISLSPGQTRTLKFWLMADQKGPAGQEWKPVEDLYGTL